MAYSRKEVGDIYIKFRTEKEISFDWRIRNTLPKELDADDYTSPYVPFLGTTFRLNIHKAENFYQEECVLFQVKTVNFRSVHYSLGIKTADGTEMEIVRDKILSKDYGCNIITKLYLQFSKIITVTCRIRSNHPPPDMKKIIAVLNDNTESVTTAASARNGQSVHLDSTAKMMVSRETQTENVSDTGARGEELDDHDIKSVFILRKHLKDLLLKEGYHDVTFKVKDQKFRAHRNMLTARSPVFAAMFNSEMKESTDDPLDIVDCSPEDFGEFLQYVYTGKVENFSPNVALGLYYAGDKYDVSGLKEVCVQFLKTSLSTTSICEIITLAARYGEDELYEQAMAFFSEHLEEIMDTNEWQQFLAESQCSS